MEQIDTSLDTAAPDAALPTNVPFDVHDDARHPHAEDVLDALSAMTAVLSPNGTIRSANRAWMAASTHDSLYFTGMELGRSYVDACREAEGPNAHFAHNAAADIRSVLAGTERGLLLDYPVGDRQERWFTLHVSPLPCGDAVVLSEEITEFKRVEAMLEYQSMHDPLTGLPNRTLFLDRLGQALARLGRGASQIAVMFVDLDRFKVVNDSLGHEAGDRLLVTQAERIRDVLRPSDTVARLSGDEFAVLCENVIGDEDVETIAGRVAAAVSQPVMMEDGEVFVTPSVGVALCRDPGVRPEALLRDADSAMQRAKERGRNRYEIFDETLRARAVNRLRVESGLRGALERDELRLFYQPQVRVDTGKIVGMEALVRWEHPERGLLAPNDFIQVAEDSGLIVPIGEWVLREACQQADRWLAARPADPLMMCVNLSAHQLSHPGLAETVASAFSGTRLYPANLCLEITESVLMDEAESTMAALRELKSVGVGLAIDDFGTGHSSLVYLKRFPVDMLKVDRSFVDGLGRDADDTAIVTAVLSLANALGLTAIAEGVETNEQREELEALGCSYAQGYHFAKPAAPEVITELLSGNLPVAAHAATA